MVQFPRTVVGGISLPRMIIGTNWFLGFSHRSVAQDNFIKRYHNAKSIAEVFGVFMEAGVDAVMGQIATTVFADAVKEAQERTGKRMIVVDTPSLALIPGGVDLSATARILDNSARLGATFCMPHQSSTDRLLDRSTKTIRQMDLVCKMIRERGMIPGLSTHSPETPGFADNSGLDVETYIQIYNAAGFLMGVEVEWVHRIIQKAKKPVMTIKPMAAGRLTPLVGLAFVWSTIRDQDMVTVGTFSADEAREVIEISLSLLERRSPHVELQRTRSKESIIIS